MVSSNSFTKPGIFTIFTVTKSGLCCTFITNNVCIFATTLVFFMDFFGPRVTGAVGYAYVRLHCKKNVVEMIDGGRHCRSFLGWILKHKKSILRKGLHRYKNALF